MMELLPPLGWADVATKRDLDKLEKVTRQDIAQVEERLAQRIDSTRHDVAQLEERLGVRIAQVDERLGMQIDSSANALRAEFANQTRQIVVTLVPVIVAVNGMGVAIAALLS